MTAHSQSVYIIDRDPGVRGALSKILWSAGYCATIFDSISEFNVFRRAETPACVVLELNLPGTSELELQYELKRTGGPPVIFLNGRGDIRTSVRAMKAGAVELLQKPVCETDLLRAVETGIALDREARARRSQLAELEKHYSRLTPRERDVLPLVAAGLLNRQTAVALGTSEITVRVHRGQIMRKMGAASFPDLVRMADKLGVPSPQPTYINVTSTENLNHDPNKRIALSSAR